MEPGDRTHEAREVGPRKSDRLRDRPLSEVHRRRHPRPLATFTRRPSPPRRRWTDERLRRLAAACAMGAVVLAILLAGWLGAAWTALVIGAGLGGLATLLRFDLWDFVERRFDADDGGAVRAALDVAPLALALAPGLALLPSLRWSLLALPALGWSAAAVGLWIGSARAVWVWRASSGLVLAWSAHLALTTLPELADPADFRRFATALGALLGALGIGAIGWWTAGHVEHGLARGPDPEAP